MLLFTFSASAVSKLTRTFQSENFQADHTDKLAPAAAGQSIAKHVPGLNIKSDTRTKIVKSKLDSTGL